MFHRWIYYCIMGHRNDRVLTSWKQHCMYISSTPRIQWKTRGNNTKTMVDVDHDSRLIYFHSLLYFSVYMRVNVYELWFACCCSFLYLNINFECHKRLTFFKTRRLYKNRPLHEFSEYSYLVRTNNPNASSCKLKLLQMSLF